MCVRVCFVLSFFFFEGERGGGKGEGRGGGGRFLGGLLIPHPRGAVRSFS